MGPVRTKTQGNQPRNPTKTVGKMVEDCKFGEIIPEDEAHDEEAEPEVMTIIPPKPQSPLNTDPKTTNREKD